MLTLARSIIALILGSGLVLLGNGLLGTVVSLRMVLDGYSALTTGLVLSAYYLGFTFGALSITRLVARVGHIRVFAAMAATACAAVLLMSLLPHPVAWVPLRCIIGFSMAGVFMVIESWLNARASGDTRGTLLAVYMLVVQLALGGGQLFVPLYAPTSVEPFVLVAGLYALALVPVALTHVEQPPLPGLARYGLGPMFRIAPLGLAGCAIAGTVTSVLLTLGPLYMVGLGRSVDEAAVFMSVSVVGGLALQWPLGRLSDRLGRRPVLIAVCTVLSGIALLLAMIEIRTMTMLLASGALVGALAFVIYPLALAYTNDLLHPDNMVEASGTLLLAFGAGSAAGPLVGSGWIWLLGADGVFAWIAASAGFLALGTGYRLILRPRLPGVDRAAYVPVSLPQTAPAGQLDPRGDADY